MTITIHESQNAWIYPTLVGLSLVGLLLWPTSGSIPKSERRKYWIVQTVTLVSAIVGAKFAMLAGDLGWPFVSLDSYWELVISGRSITGGLAFGFIGAEIAKPIVGYRLPPNDAFAAKLPFSIALGRVGCVMAGCCRGIAHHGLVSMVYEDGIPRWPAQIIEIVFQLVLGVIFIGMVRRRVAHGRVFALYMIAYGAFRFVTEFMRETPKPFGAFSVYQVFSLGLIALGAISLAARTRAKTMMQVQA